MSKKIKSKPINFVHKHMVEQHQSVAHKSEKDYDRKRDKAELKKKVDYGSETDS